MSEVGNNVVVHKMTGSGNDFVFVDGRQSAVSEWLPDRIRLMCDRKNGVGSDGLVVLEPGSAGNRLKFNYFNADGSRGELCGNASLCAARFAVRFGMTANEMVLETDIGPISAEAVAGPGQRARITLPDLPAPIKPSIRRAPDEDDAWFLTVGVPHLVLKMVGHDPESAQVEKRGRALRYNKTVSQVGSNVNFLTQLPSGAWRMRTYERGVEAETLACGTGAAAAAASLVSAGMVQLPWTVQTSSGAELTVSGDFDADVGVVKNASLTGEGRYLFRAELSF